MESIKHSIVQLSEHFNHQMAEFQKNLQSASIPATSPTSNLASQFNIFRDFVLSSLEALQIQVTLLSKKYDVLEMRSRRKILLIHGIPESKNENVTQLTLNELSSRLKIDGISVETISRCHRMGNITSEKPRPILIKFKDLAIRDSVWFAKSNLKNTGITISEFLTKERHGVFMSARQRFGVSKCWTRDGRIFIIDASGKRHQILTHTELDAVTKGTVQVSSQRSLMSTGAGVSNNTKDNKQLTQAIRSKRLVKK